MNELKMKAALWYAATIVFCLGWSVAAYTHELFGLLLCLALAQISVITASVYAMKYFGHQRFQAKAQAMIEAYGHDEYEEDQEEAE